VDPDRGLRGGDVPECAHQWVNTGKLASQARRGEGRGRLDKVLRCVDCDEETVEPGQAAERPPLNFGAGAAT
jgi:hypothetical protein